jgi:4-amino-4-deoxy-L-arabinose transferase-like glycosyltransferase
MTRNKIFSFLKKNRLIILIWLLGLFVRIYRLDQLLGFHYDQGRDALIAHDILTFKNFPAIGPTTGIEGLYLGPFWFYLITPAYFLARGDPAVAAAFIALLESFSIPLLFFLLKRYHRLGPAYLAAFIWALSRYIVHSARWFSNPTPLPTFVLLLIFFLSQIYIEKKTKYWPLVALLLGLSLQLEAASAVFFIPVIGLLFLLSIKKKNKSLVLPINLKQFLLSLLAFFSLLIPQFFFEIKNNFLVSKNFLAFLTGKTNTTTGQSWALPDLSFIKQRMGDYYQIFFSKLDTNLTNIGLLFLLLFLFSFLLYLKKQKTFSLKTRKFIQINLFWLFIPLFLLLFFVGNYGQLYDYYLTGLFPVFVLLFSFFLTNLLPRPQYFLPLLIIFLFLKANLIHLYNFLIANPDGPTHISLGNQQQSVRFICQDSREKNVDVYLPPVIPYPYDYLFLLEKEKGHCQLSLGQVPLLYTLAEVDPSGPQRFEAWMNRQDSFSRVLKETRFGGIIVQERARTDD